MTNIELNQALYERLNENFTDFIREANDALKKGNKISSAKDVLFEYAFRYNTFSNIIMAKDNYPLSDIQCEALLSCGTPLEIIYDSLMKSECDVDLIDEIQSIITNEADFQVERQELVKSKISVISVEPGKEPVLKKIESNLESLQHEVGGYIEATYPFFDPVAIVCNEEGKLTGLPLNRAMRDEEGGIYDIICGTFLIVGLGSEDFSSVPKEFVDKYIEMYKEPEIFMRYNDEILAIKENEKEKIPVYLSSDKYAIDNNEVEAYQASFKANRLCKKAIEKSLGKHYADNRLDGSAVYDEVVKEFGEERVKTVLANTCVEKDSDQRISRENKEWAKSIPLPDTKNSGWTDNKYFVCERPHIGLVNLLVDKARIADEQKREKKPSVISKHEANKDKVKSQKIKNKSKEGPVI